MPAGNVMTDRRRTARGSFCLAGARLPAANPPTLPGDCCHNSNKVVLESYTTAWRMWASTTMQPCNLMNFRLVMLVLMLMVKQLQLNCTVAFYVIALLLNAIINNDQDDFYLQAESHTLLNPMLHNK
ncbi:unnamed protein product [Tetraodon nigroviridis]|uniref:(spotted green pufferfish) hypothetical protein n=1 Tax=Tetraodon nigroviridis TaxID=99883 RepID=Q4RET8_TETNG|nr:unnamed protein product [Tetraodon nigroviridis]